MTALGNILAGGRITAAEVQGVAPLAALKGADQSVTSSTVLVNDSALLLGLLANAAYLFVATLDYEGGTLGSSDLKWQWGLPAGATMRYHRWGIDTAGASTVGFLTTETGVPAAGSSGAGNLKAVSMLGTVSVSATAGLMQLKWAQNTSSATATIIHAASVLAAWQIA